jgi:hypothetical protein
VAKAEHKFATRIVFGLVLIVEQEAAVDRQIL